MRLPLAIPLDSRSGSSTVDARLTNAIVENYEGRLTVSKRPGLTQLSATTGNGNGVVCFNGSLFSLFGTAAYKAVTSGGVSWAEVSTPTGIGFGCVGFGNGLFVALPNSTGTTFATSTDGITWTNHTTGLPAASASWVAITYAAGTWVALDGGTTNKCITSTDGLTWTQQTLPASASWTGVAYGNGVFCAIRGNTSTNQCATSPDGVTWTARTMASSVDWQAIAYANSTFVATASGTTTSGTSPDGITWTARTMPSADVWASLAYGNGLFVALGYASTAAASSPDGVTWTARTLPSAVKWFGVVFGESNFVATSTDFAGTGSDVASTSDDGITWTQRTMASAKTWRKPTYGAGRFVTVDGNTTGTATYSTGDTSYTVSAGTVEDSVHDFAQSGSSTTLFFKSTTKAYTYDGSTVTLVSDVDYPTETVRGVAYLDGRMFVCTPRGKVYQSADENFASWAALDFISANTEPDEAVFLCKYRDYIMVLKQWSCEFFYDAANATGSILAPVRNMFQLIGCASSETVRNMAGTVVWMGKTKDGEGRSIYMMAGSEPQPISTPQVDRLLDADDLTTVSSWSARLGSHQFYGINLSSISLAYDFSSGLWSRFTYLTASGVTKTISAITTAGVVTSTVHGYSDGDIIKVSGTNASWDGWHVVTTVSTNAYSIQGTGTAFSGSGTSEKHTEGAFPIEQSTSCGGKQVMQADGKLYEFLQDTTTDPIGAIASRVRTVKFDGGVNTRKTFGEVEVIGDKVSDYLVMRHSDDDFQTFSRNRPVDLSLNRSRLRRMGDANRRAFEILHVGDSAIRLEALEISAEG